MSEEHIEVILNELNHIKEDIAEIKDSLKYKCDTCVNATKFRERLRSQWVHILALWTVVGTLAITFYNHVAGK